ncbi:hypothetical protein R3P38DRAFT_3037254 [Favolaschia claudopus]|uniref:Uncharacterized protein n=1 Tax=Favolaschia claudopus TaxID=2862362 RepID=A0AAW0AB25_9AGAR
MNHFEDLVTPLPQNARNRRLSDPGLASDRLPQLLSRRNSDPGRGFSVFALRDFLRPVIAQSANHLSDGRRGSYAGTSSATQSFVSFDSMPTDTPTHSAAAFSTASDGGEPEIGRTPYDPIRHDGPARSNTMYTPQATSGQRHDPRRAATMGPDPRHPSTQGSQRQFGHPDLDSIPDVVLGAGDQTIRQPERQGTRDTTHSGYRRDVRDLAADVDSRSPQRQPSLPNPFPDQTEEQHAPSDADPRRSYKVSATPTVVPGRSSTSRPDDAAQAYTQDPRQRRPSATSNKAARPSFQDPLQRPTGSRADEPPRRSVQDSRPPLPAAASNYTDEPPRTSAEASRQRLPSAASARPHETRPPLPSATSNRVDEAARTSIEASRQRLPSAASTRPQDARPRLPSNASNRVNAAPPHQAVAPSTPKPAAQQEPPTPTTVRPSTNSNRPATPASSTYPPKHAAPEPRRQAMARSSAAAAIASSRPPLPPSMSQMDTRYVRMLLAIDSIPPLYNILASFFTWILLAGFVLFPGTFTSLQSNPELGALGVTAVNVVKHVSLYVIAWVCTATGAIGMAWLWYRWRLNYIWCLNRVFLPGFMNSLAGVLSTVASIFGTQDATLSISSTSTIIVTSSIAGICGILTLFYMFVLIRRIKKQHDEEVGKQRAGKHGEGLTDLSKRKAGAAKSV